MKALQIITVVGVAVAVIAGFFIIGSPMQARLQLFDAQRVNDLQRIQSEIVNYWQMKGRLPETLNALRDDIRGFVPPADPETKAPYEYMVKGPMSFSLCATFVVPSVMKDAGPVTYDMGQFYHGSGRQCFERTIDKDLYPPVPMKAIPVIQ